MTRRTYCHFQAFSALLFAGAFWGLTACGPMQPSVPRDTTSSQSLQKSSFHARQASAPEINYPGAVVFEGGLGNPRFDSEGTRHSPLWRLTLCLGNTQKLTHSEVALNFEELGQPVVTTWIDGDTHEFLHSEKLTHLLLAFDYTTGFESETGLIDFLSKSTQNWIPYKSKPGYDPGPHRENMDLNFFNLQISSGTLQAGGEYLYEVDRTKYYLSFKLDRAGLNSDHRTFHKIKICEDKKIPHIFETFK